MQIKFTKGCSPSGNRLGPIIMKTIVLLWCTSVFSLSSNELFSQRAKVFIESDGQATIFEVFELIGDQTECTFIYGSNIFSGLPKINLKKGRIEVMTLLRNCLPDSEFRISEPKENYITISRKIDSSKPQDRIEIKGRVRDSIGENLVGVNVLVKGTRGGTITDTEGSYNLFARPMDTLLFSMIGFKHLIVPIVGRSLIDVVLQEDVTELGSVTINAGYYTVNERENTGSFVSISEEEIEQQPISNPLAALQGRMAGVEIVQTSGVAGAGFEIKIRGQNSIRQNANNPLYVIDGVPYSSESLGERQGSAILPDAGISPLNDINPTDIESIEILKDADATSIYGSRGANGVVLITTKKGSIGETRFYLNLTTGLGEVSNMLNLLGTEDYLEMRRQSFANDGVDEIPFSAYDINGTWDENRETDWQEVLFGKTALIKNYQGSVSGGNPINRFLLSGNLYTQSGVFPGKHKNEKISTHGNFSHTSADDNLTIHFSANYTTNKNNLPGEGLLTLKAKSLPPNAPELYNDDGSLNWENSSWTNPLGVLEGIYRANSSNLLGNLNIGYWILDNLSLKTNLGYTENHLTEINTVPSTIYDPAYGVGPQYSYAIHNTGQRKSWIIEPQLDWEFMMGETEISMLTGLTFQDSKDERLSQYAVGFSNNRFIENISAASSLISIADLESQYRYQAIYGRININHKGKYFFNLTGRRDGSSRFGDNRRFANFGAIGTAWIFTKENFLEDLSFINFGKIKASYGTSGNDQIGDYQYLDTYSFGDAQYQNTIGIFPTRLYNPDFSWEENKKFNLGLEVGLLADRINIETNYYINRSSNQLVGIPLPATTGFNSINANLDATVENTGWELQVSTLNLRTENFSWKTSLNITIPKNRLVSFKDLEGSTYANRLVIGEPLNIRKVYNLTGVDASTGLYTYQDYNSDGNISSPDDAQFIKRLDPTFYGGLSCSLKYKDLRLDFLLNFVKQEGYNYWYQSGFPVGEMSNQLDIVTNRWQSPGDQTSVQRYSTGLDSDAFTAYSRLSSSTGAISDASYLRLKTLSLSYSILDKKNLGFDCEVFLRGQNLFTVTDYLGLDPETRSQQTIPPLRILSIGTNINL